MRSTRLSHNWLPATSSSGPGTWQALQKYSINPWIWVSVWTRQKDSHCIINRATRGVWQPVSSESPHGRYRYLSPPQERNTGCSLLVGHTAQLRSSTSPLCSSPPRFSHGRLVLLGHTKFWAPSSRAFSAKTRHPNGTFPTLFASFSPKHWAAETNKEQPRLDLRGMVKATLVLNACVIEQLEKWCGNTLILRDKNRVQDHISVFSVLCDYNRVFFKTWAELRAQQSVWLWVILSQFLHLRNQL